jgi:hypothetical protein
LLNVNIQYGFYDSYNGAGGEFAWLKIELWDTTDSTWLLSMSNPYSGSWSGSVNQNFDVNPNDVYEFSVSGWSDTYDMDYGAESVTASITVPEPGVCSLCLLGFLSLAGFKKWPSELRRLNIGFINRLTQLG